LFPAFCALVALIAAAVTLAAPTLRPEISGVADKWLGGGNAVSRVLAPSPALEAGWRQARAEAMQALDAHLSAYTARMDQLAAAQQATASDVARAEANLRADHTTGEALSRAVDDLSRQTNDLRTATAAIDGRARAAGLLTLSLRLRRDVDVGLPISRDVSALAAAGPFPPAVERSLQQLRRINDGAPTMRDLADEFDSVLARLAARTDAEASWASRGWTRLATMFGGPSQAGNANLIEHLRALASEGRFSEAADEIQASNDSDLGAKWVARVRTRATAVVATQALLAYSLVAYENAFAATGPDAGGRLTQ
jgi:cell division protein FtsB